MARRRVSTGLSARLPQAALAVRPAMKLPDLRSVRGAGIGRQLAVGSAGTLLVRGCGMALAAVTAALLARALGSADYGRYVWAFAWVNILALIAIMGFDRLLVRHLSDYLAHDDRELVRGLLVRSHQLVAFAALTLAAVAGGIGYLALSGDDPQRRVFLVGAALVPVLALNLVRQAALQAHGWVATGRLPDDILRPALLGMAVIAVGMTGSDSLDSADAMGLHLGAAVITFAVGSVALRRVTSATRDAAPTTRSRVWLAEAAPLWWVSIGAILLVQADVVLLGLLATTEQAGIYEVVSRLAAVAGLVEFGLGAAMSPLVARLWATGEREQLVPRIGRITSIGLFATFAVAALVVLSGEPVLGLFGPEFERGTEILWILALSSVLSAAAGPNGVLLSMTGHGRPAARLTSVAVVINVACNLVLVPLLGLQGAAWSWLITVVVWNAMFAVRARQLLGFDASIIAPIWRLLRGYRASR